MSESESRFYVQDEFVIDRTDGSVRYDDMRGRVGEIVADLLNYVDVLEAQPKCSPRPDTVTEEMLQAAMSEAVRVGLFPKYATEKDYVRNWQGMKAAIQAALNA